MDATVSKINAATQLNKNGVLKHLQHYFGKYFVPKRTKKVKKSKSCSNEFEKTPLHLAIAGYISYMFLFCVGWLRETIFGLGPINGSQKNKFQESNREGYAPLYASFESFYTRNVFRRLKYVFSQPIASCPGAKVTLIERKSENDYWTLDMVPNATKECVNLGSYNYLGE